MENNKKLERDTQHKVIGGVCSGLANYFDIDATLLRVLFAFLFLFASAGFWLYVILWIVMPAASTQRIVDENGQTIIEVPEQKQISKGSLVLGLILIATGALALLHRFVPNFTWETIWPVLLIVLGMLLLFPSKDRKS
ncbi:MAG: PspC domain-containing protein [Bacteroidales bacterium]|nr:PspC domain-containing protein [Bacteroidales bacterium]